MIDQAFDIILSKLPLTTTEKKRVTDSVNGITKYLAAYYKISEKDVVLQGSCASNTVVRALPQREYDVDVVVLCALPEDTPDKALEDLESAFAKNDIYSPLLSKKKKKTCIRLEYAEDQQDRKFHVDVIPARRNQLGEIEVPRRGGAWKLSKPEEYAQWCINQGQNFHDVVLMLKRWRDVNQNVRHSIKSILFQVIISKCLGEGSTHEERLVNTFSNMATFLETFNSASTVDNPVLPSEDLAEHWDQECISAFKNTLKEALEVIGEARAFGENEECLKLWADLLGDDFPTNSQIQVVERLGDTSHAHSLATLQVTDTSVGAKKLTITAKKYAKLPPTNNGRRNFSRTLRVPYHSGGTVAAGTDLEFRTVPENRGAMIHWQVVNTGTAAKDASCLRGEFYDSNDGSSYIRHEPTQYPGTHYIQAFAVVGDKCVQKSDPFYVKIA